MRVELLREELLHVRARIRALETRAQAAPLSETATAKLGALQRKAARLQDTLHKVSRDIPPDLE